MLFKDRPYWIKEIIEFKNGCRLYNIVNKLSLPVKKVGAVDGGYQD